ncbi:MAG: hotdog domain-containing protein [Alphaproteobacteria bacterium]|jgi:predicted thioesterase|nr:hotdog domain-containing protein [Alphaproteobacteria bacterium]HJM61173.1 hotdog domain-containing protein [Alphaproteobacteria bacterium]
MSELEVGARHSLCVTVDEENTISFLGEDLRVYATPAMVHDVEYCCRDWLAKVGGAEKDSVGAHINIAHLAPTTMGAWVEITVTVAEIAGPLITFDVDVRDAIEQVGKGSHQRFFAPVAKLDARLKAKAAALAAKT